MNMKNETYDKLKILVTIVIPAFITFWTAISGIWGIPFVEQITGTLAAIAAFIGALLKISTARYNMKEETDMMGRGEEDGLQADEEKDS